MEAAGREFSKMPASHVISGDDTMILGHISSGKGL